MVAGFSLLLAKIAALVQWFSDIFVAIFVSLWDIIKDGFSWLFEQVLSVAITALAGIDTTGITGGLVSFGSLPADVLAVLAACGLGQAMGIVSAAILVRFTLQLIPFTRLGS